MQNLQYNCFINSSIQTLFCIDSFNNVILDKIKQDTNNFKYPLLKEYCRLIQQNNNDKPIITMKQFLFTVYQLKPDYTQQSDANEFLLWFSKKIVKSLKSNDLFQGIETYNLRYKCNHFVSNKQQTFRTIFIKNTDIQKYKDLQSILINKSSEIIQDAVCDVCQQSGDLEVTKQITTLPYILNIQIFKDKNTEIQIDMEMTIQTEIPHYYILKSVIFYQGNSLNGHYICIVKNSQQWTICNDTQIIDIQDKLTQTLYNINNKLITLIYEKLVSKEHPSDTASEQ